MPDHGVRLQLYIGPTKPTPAPYEVMDALRSVEVTNKDQDFDGFQISFSLGKGSVEYGLLAGGMLDPDRRVVIAVNFGTQPEVLIDGIIEKHTVRPSNRPGESTLYIYGKDISSKLHREDKDKQHPNQSDSEIVTQLINAYSSLGVKAKVTKTDDVPAQSDRIPSQQCSDLSFIRQRAQHNGYVFYLEPTAVGESTAYWGPDNRSGEVQPPLTLNMGPDTNVDDPPNVDFDAMGPVEPDVTFVDPITKRTIHVPLPASLHPSLAKQAAAALRKTLSRNTANLNFVQALLKALSTVSESSDAVTINNEVDAVRYGRVLRARRLVKVRGVGQSYDGTFYVKEVVHSIRRGEYKQRFKLIREGRGAA